MQAPSHTIKRLQPRRSQRHNLLGMDREALQQLAVRLGEPAYRGRQLFEWLYRHRVWDFDRMSSLSRSFRDQLKSRYIVQLPAVVKEQAGFDGTVKYLFELEDGERVEAVIIPEGERRTLCISSQVGCLVGCKFCATGLMGFRRNLTAGEIVGQLLALSSNQSLPPGSRGGIEGGAITNVVMMGMGEPLLNRREVFAAARLMTDLDGMGIPARKFTISTAGWLPGIKAMTGAVASAGRRIAATQEDGSPHPSKVVRITAPDGDSIPRIKLAISLNATTDEHRRRLMPLVAKHRLSSIVAAAREYAQVSGYPVAFSYLLLAGENDTDADAQRLIKLLTPWGAFTPPAIAGGDQGRVRKSKEAWCKVNLMEYNDVGSPYTRTDPARAEGFLKTLRDAGLTVTLRTSRGSDIAGACGQLAGGYKQGSGKMV